MQRNRSLFLSTIFLSVAVGVLAFALVGCGGDDATDDTASTTLPTTPPTTAAAIPEDAFADLIGTQLVATDETPPDVKESLDVHVPVVIAFYVTGGTDDSVVLETLDKIALRNSDVDLYTYDYKTPDLYGDLAGLLHVDYPPQVAFIDSDGFIRGVISGYADEGTLNQLFVNIR